MMIQFYPMTPTIEATCHLHNFTFSSILDVDLEPVQVHVKLFHVLTVPNRKCHWSCCVSNVFKLMLEYAVIVCLKHHIHHSEKTAAPSTKEKTFVSWPIDGFS